ncbi:MAG: SDR family NAD(P)-dependent oxidoreductase [Polyangiaceae bacterium]|nr:SDR family NAD(P)-dependent oxidoreductase [Polyangiaceae bacterium]
MDIRDNRVCITGASSGIGEACARAFAAAGAHVCLVARRIGRLEVLSSELASEHGVEVHCVSLDVRDRGRVESFASELPDSWKQLDILVNNAGLSRGLDPIQRASVDDWDEMIDTNVKGLLYVTRSLVSAMVGRGKGHIINIGSIAGHEVYGGGSVYCATKHAVSAINRSMAIDLLGTGVRVSSVDPGMVETEFSLVRFHGDQQRAAGVYKGILPLMADDVADAVLYCATRPPHANVREMVLMPSAQASVMHSHRTQ